MNKMDIDDLTNRADIVINSSDIPILVKFQTAALIAILRKLQDIDEHIQFPAKNL